VDKVRQWLYYFLIGIISFISLVFLPMLGSSADLGWNLPTTAAGWAVWVVTKLIVSVLNVLLFHCFMEQAKLNVKDNEKYKAAFDMLYKIAPKVYKPRSPKQWNKRQYLTKGITIFAFTALSTVALTQAILTFDYVSLLTYLFTIVLGVIFGIIQMKKAEVYWTTEFYDFAVTFHEQHKEESKEETTDVIDNRQQDIQESRGTSPQE
jgi:uncharacterized membrane protein